MFRRAQGADVSWFDTRKAHIWREVLEDADERAWCRLVLEHKADFDKSQCSSSDECVAEEPMDLADQQYTYGELTLDEIMRACSWALIPQPVMMMMTAGTNERLPLRLRKMPSIPPAHHRTPIIVCCMSL